MESDSTHRIPASPEIERLQRELASARARFDATLNAAVDGIVTIDDKGTIQVFNAGAERIFGFSAAEVIGRNVSMLMPSPDRENHDGYLANYLRTGTRRIIGIGREVLGQRKDGSSFPLELAIGEVSTTPPQFVGLLRDVSWRKAAESALRSQQEELRLIINSAPIGIVMADRDCRIRLANPAFQRLCGRPEQELTGLAFERLVH